jgi:hypothetical protein
MNNNKLSVPKASPSQSGSTDGTSGFEMGRRTYLNMFSKLQSPAPAQNPHKKWMSSNRDASTIIANRRNKEIGKGTFNLDINKKHQTISYCNNHDVNLIQRRRMFTRSGGATVPQKCRGSNL